MLLDSTLKPTIAWTDERKDGSIRMAWSTNMSRVNSTIGSVASDRRTPQVAFSIFS